MTAAYDKYYKTENLFGEPYPELIDFLNKYPKKGKILDLGCGQGRDSIPLARIGFSVTGIDISKVGIEQMNAIGKAENLNLVGQVEDIYAFDKFEEFDIILLDSIFHFTKKDRKKEIELVKRIFSKSLNGCLVIFCIQDTGSKVETLNQAIDFEKKRNRLVDRYFKYTFEDEETGHKSETNYRMIVIER